MRVFAFRMKKPWVSYPLSAHRILSLRWAHTHFVGFVMGRLIYCGTGWFDGTLMLYFRRNGSSYIVYPLKLNVKYTKRQKNSDTFCFPLTRKVNILEIHENVNIIWTPSSEFVSSSIPSLQILTAHAQPFRGARDMTFCLKVPLDSLIVWASSDGSGETARMRRLASTFAARIGDKVPNSLDAVHL